LLSQTQPEESGEDSAPSWNVTAKTEWGVQLLTCNLSKPGPVAHLAFREALHMILDRRRMIDDLGGARQEPAFGLLPVREEKVRDAQGVVEESHVDEEASQAMIHRLLGDASYNGETLHLYTFDDLDHVEDVQWIRERCAAYGVVIEAHFCTVPELSHNELILQADLILDGSTVSENLDLSLLDLYLTENSFIKNHLSRELAEFVQERITLLRKNSSLQARLDIWQEIEQELLSHHAYLGLYRNQAQLLSHPELQGVALNAQGWSDFRQMWFKQRDMRAE
jgi:MarR-like DNA-binding transcriptional regulator SgrR of sgrS sRNA